MRSSPFSALKQACPALSRLTHADPMNSLQVSVAVSAVASAFHSGAELLKQLKKQRKKRRGEDAYREKTLLESLEHAETQIEERYAIDSKELGQSVRIGDSKCSYSSTNLDCR